MVSGLTRSEWVLLGLTVPYSVFSCPTGFYKALPSLNGSYRALPDLTGSFFLTVLFSFGCKQPLLKFLLLGPIRRLCVVL